MVGFVRDKAFWYVEINLVLSSVVIPSFLKIASVAVNNLALDCKSEYVASET